MKKLLICALAILVAGVTTLTPRVSYASEPVKLSPSEQAAADARNAQNMSDFGTAVLIIGAVALVVVAVDNMPRCGDQEHKYCDRHDERNCEYQRVSSEEIMTQCTQYRRYSEYDCVLTELSSETYIKSCGTRFDHDHNRDHRR